MSRWFKMYDTVLDDPKVQRLPADVFRGWVNLLCLASKNDGRLPGLPDIAFALRISDREADSLVSALLGAGLLDDEGGSMAPHNWQSRQGVGDATNAERQRRFRERKRAEKEENDRNAVTPLRVTPLDKRREEKRREERGARARAFFPQDGSIAFSAWADIVRREAPGHDVDLVASTFRGFCRERDIPLDVPCITKTFTTFCGVFRKKARAS